MKRLVRSRKDRMIAGVCGGIGQTWGIDPNVARLVVVLLALLTAIVPVGLAYLAAWVILPQEDGAAE